MTFDTIKTDLAAKRNSWTIDASDGFKIVDKIQELWKKSWAWATNEFVTKLWADVNAKEALQASVKAINEPKLQAYFGHDAKDVFWNKVNYFDDKSISPKLTYDEVWCLACLHLMNNKSWDEFAIKDDALFKNTILGLFNPAVANPAVANPVVANPATPEALTLASQTYIQWEHFDWYDVAITWNDIFVTVDWKSVIYSLSQESLDEMKDWEVVSQPTKPGTSYYDSYIWMKIIDWNIHVSVNPGTVKVEGTVFNESSRFWVESMKLIGWNDVFASSFDLTTGDRDINYITTDWELTTDISVRWDSLQTMMYKNEVYTNFSSSTDANWETTYTYNTNSDWNIEFKKNGNMTISAKNNWLI
jgi:hypothetical protein